MRRKLEWSGEGEWCEEGGERGPSASVEYDFAGLKYSDHS